MGDIQHILPPRPLLPLASPPGARPGQGFAQLFIAELTAEQLGRLQGGAYVGRQQRTGRLCRQRAGATVPVHQYALPLLRQLFNPEIPAQAHNGRSARPPGAGQQAGRRVRVADDHRRTATHNTRFLPGDAGPVGAQPGLVVQVDTGDYRHCRVDDIDRVEAPSEPHFEHEHVHHPVPEHHQGRECGEFEIGKAGITPRRIDRLESRDNFLITGLDAAHTYTLIEPQQVGRGINAGAQSRLAEHSFQHGHSGSFTVSARHGDNRHPDRQQRERPRHRGNPLQPEVDGVRVQCLQPCQPLRE